MNTFRNNDFIFSPRFRVWRHVLFWTVHIVVWTLFWNFMLRFPLWHNLFQQLIWLPVYMLYSYPLMYWVVPKFLLNGKYVQFIFIILLWGVAGVFINYLFRVYIFISAQEAMGFKQIVRGGWQAGSYLCLAVTAASTTIIKLFKYWLIKQQEWLQAEKEKVTAELQLLKAQVHPHFLFNTLNNIYSFSLEKSPKTPDLILKLSSLLSYMLYDCKEEEVLLEKEIDSMKNYIDLEKERYGNKIEISWMVVGDVRDKFIAPLLLLPFLENAFKHGTSDQVEKPWLSVDISVTGNILKCKMINSKNVSASGRNGGIGIQNVKKRLTFIYPDKHELKMNDEGNYFVVFLWIELKNQLAPEEFTSPVFIPVAENVSI